MSDYNYKYNDRTKYMHLTVAELAQVVLRFVEYGMSEDKAIDLVASCYLDVGQIEQLGLAVKRLLNA